MMSRSRNYNVHMLIHLRSRFHSQLVKLALHMTSLPRHFSPKLTLPKASSISPQIKLRSISTRQSKDLNGLNWRVPNPLSASPPRKRSPKFRLPSSTQHLTKPPLTQHHLVMAPRTGMLSHLKLSSPQTMEARKLMTMVMMMMREIQ